MDSRNLVVSAVVGIALGGFAILLSWLLGGESSPFHEFFLQNVSLKNLWMFLNFPAFMALILTGARSFEIGLLMVFLQWLIIGFIGSLLIRRMAGVR